MNKFTPKRIFIIFMFVLVVICLSIPENNEWSFNAEQLLVKTSNNPIFVRNDFKVARVDESDGFSGQFTGGPCINLDKGEYDIIIHYTTDTDNNYIDIFSTIKEFNKDLLKDKDLKLYANENEKKLTVNLEQGGSFLEVRTFFNGIGLLEIESINFVRHEAAHYNKLIYLSLICIMLFSGLLFNLPDKFVVWLKSLDRADKLAYFYLLLAAIMVSYPLLNDYVTGHDMEFHLNRIEGIKDGLSSGQFPVRIHPTHFGGYGYATPIMYPELFLYIPAIFRLCGLSLIVSYQIFCLLINIFTAYISYFSFRKIARSKYIGLTSSILYTFAWYRLCNMYVRSALGESLAMVFLPLFLLGLYYLIYGDYKKWMYAVLGYSCILQSHILSAFLSCVFSLLISVIFYKRLIDRNRLKAILKAIGITVLVNLWFIVPFAIFYTLDFNIKSAYRFVHEFAIRPAQLFMVSYIQSKDILDYYDITMLFRQSLMLGAGIIVSTILFFVAGLNNNSRFVIKLGWFSLIIGSFCAYATTTYFPWRMLESIPLFSGLVNAIQFPWRLLGYADVFLCFVGGIGSCYFIRGISNKKVFLMIFFIISFLSSSFILDQSVFSKPYIYKYDNVNTYGSSIGWGEYLYKGTDIKKLEVNSRKYEFFNNDFTIEKFHKNGTNISFDYKIVNDNNQNRFIELPLLYYPGYIAHDNFGNDIAIERGSNNVVRLILPNQDVHIELYYRGNRSFLLAEGISFVAIILCLFRFYRKKDCRG